MGDENQGVSAAEPPGIGLLALLLVLGLAFVFEAGCRAGSALGRLLRGR